MGIGTIRTRVLTDIANAIRLKAGLSRTYRPSEMAAAVRALDGTDAGEYAAQPYKALESGVLSSHVLDDIGDAIRAQNGSETRYAPTEMAEAILALTWEGVKAHALLLTDGTLEFNWRVGARSDLGEIAQSWEVDTEGYDSAAARPWHQKRDSVKRVVFDPDFAGAGVTNLDYWFNSMQKMVEIAGFENLPGLRTLELAFASCGNLETIWASSFDPSSLERCESYIASCHRLVGGQGMATKPGLSTMENLRLGKEGLLTDPEHDGRVWVWSHLYRDGGLVITSSDKPEAGRSLTMSRHLVSNARYSEGAGLPWNNHAFSVKRVEFADDLDCDFVSLDYWFYNMSSLTSVTGWRNVPGVETMRYAFANCTALVELDLRGLDPSGIVSWPSAFSRCQKLTTIYVDPTWELAQGATGTYCFYGCYVIVGGNGTDLSMGGIDVEYMVIDREGRPGYLTAGE